MYLMYGQTDIGKKRSLNQDIFKLGQNADAVWAIVCDGLGGENAGEVASYIAVNAADRYIKDNLEALKNQQEAKELVINAINTANSVVIQKANAAKNLEGMSTTIVCLMVYNNMLHVANVGDSRAYTILNNKITQITKDHSVVQALLDSGKISKEQAENHPNKNCLVQVLGLNQTISPAYFCQEFFESLKVLVCTDGLYNYLTEEDIIFVLNNFKAEKMANEFINLALKRGGADNITVVTIEKD